jgi:hypothetical protein
VNSIETLAYYLETDLGECARITVPDASPDRIDIIPRDPLALPIRINGAPTEIPSIEFDSIASRECFGNAHLVEGQAITPLEELALMIAAVALDGARLYRGSFGRKLLVLGRCYEGWASGKREIARWAPIQTELPSMLAFLQPPRYRATSPSLFRIRAYRRFQFDSGTRATEC